MNRPSSSSIDRPVPQAASPSSGIPGRRPGASPTGDARNCRWSPSSTRCPMRRLDSRSSGRRWNRARRFAAFGRVGQRISILCLSARPVNRGRRLRFLRLHRGSPMWCAPFWVTPCLARGRRALLRHHRLSRRPPRARFRRRAPRQFARLPCIPSGRYLPFRCLRVTRRKSRSFLCARECRRRDTWINGK